MPQWKQQYGEDHILYIDESGINTNETAEYGWSPKGQRCHAFKSGGHGTRLSMISAVRSNAPFKFIQPLVFQGSCDRNIFVCWLEYLLQVLKQKDDQTKSYLLILDNASIHKCRVIDDLAARYQIRIVYLPAYSPDLNPIERAWSVLKSKVRHMVAHSNKTLPDALDIAFKMM
ncbi:IS630 family transposase [Acinetobacter sp. 187]|uniref:IS630 family transposase n=1 Tax=Acinetobacter lanii TaxID=2715163 RepID=UPI00140A3E33|nr:IS630 family transposase [Acinetobacter lanii]NHC03239.1 IS630 family transposase [Acinetobacter lanii]